MNKRKPLIIIAGVALLAVAGLFGVKTWCEAKLRGDLEQYLANLPAPLAATVEHIDVSFFDRSYVVSNLKVNFEDANGKLDATIRQISVSGLSIKALMNAGGTIKLADRVEILDIDVNGAEVKTRIGKYILEDVSGDISQINKANAQIFLEAAKVYNQRTSDINPEDLALLAGSLADAFKSYETVFIGKSTTENYFFEDSASLMTMDKSVVSQWSTREIGRAEITGLSAAVKGIPAVRIASVSLDGATIPSFVELLKALKSSSPLSEVLVDTLRGQTFILKNLRAKDLAFHDDDGDVAATIADMTFSYESGQTHVLDFAYNDLKMELSALGDDDASNIIRDHFAEPPRLSSATRLTVSPKGNYTYDAVYTHNAKGDKLGSLSFEIALNDLTGALLINQLGPLAVKRCNATIDDKGVSDLLITLFAQEEGLSPEDARAELAQSVAQNREHTPDDALKNLLDSIAEFILRPGGSLQVDVAPIEPLPLANLLQTLLAAPESLGVTAVFTPGE